MFKLRKCPFRCSARKTCFFLSFFFLKAEASTPGKVACALGKERCDYKICSLIRESSLCTLLGSFLMPGLENTIILI